MGVDSSNPNSRPVKQVSGSRFSESWFSTCKTGRNRLYHILWGASRKTQEVCSSILNPCLALSASLCLPQAGHIYFNAGFKPRTCMYVPRFPVFRGIFSYCWGLNPWNHHICPALILHESRSTKSSCYFLPFVIPIFHCPFFCIFFVSFSLLFIKSPHPPFTVWNENSKIN